jgi:hypothetical protein
VPTDLPWAASAALGMAATDLAVLRRWHDLYGAELAAATPSALELWVERPPGDRTEAKVLAREHLAYCPAVLDEPAVARASRAGTHPLEAIAATRLGARVWRFVF